MKTKTAQTTLTHLINGDSPSFSGIDMIVWEYAKKIAEIVSTRYRDKLPFTLIRNLELAVETMNELQFLEELYFAVRTLWVQYGIADTELSDLIEKTIK